MSGDVQTDLSGNPILKDVGPWLKSEIKKRFKDADVKYIDPSYLIRSIPTTSNDRIYCKILAHNAVHAAFAGFTGVTVGLVNTHYVILPIPVVIQAPRRVWKFLFFLYAPSHHPCLTRGGHEQRLHFTYRQCHVQKPCWPACYVP